MTGTGHGLTHRLLADAFPFHLVLTADGTVRQVGEGLQKACPGVTPGRQLEEVMTVVSPAGVRLGGGVERHTRTLFLLRALDRPLTLRGQVSVDDDGLVFFLGSPWVTDAAQLAPVGITLADFAVHDPIVDFLMLVQGQAAALQDAELLAERLRQSAERTARLAEAERRLAAELQAVPDLTLRVSAQGRLLHLRPARDGDLPVSAEQATGRPVAEVLPELAVPLGPALERALRTGATQSYTYDLLRRASADAAPRRQHFEARVSRSGPDEVLVLVRDVTERRELEERLQHQARHDPLTGLGNRLRLEELAAPALARATADAPTAVLLLDLDHFKDVNDALGHAVGDELLRQVAGSLREAGRGRGELLRLGGDELVGLLPGLQPPPDVEVAEHVRAIARRMLQAIRGPYCIDGHALTVDASIGIALAPADGQQLGALLSQADTAMYEAKRAGTGVALWQDSGQRVSGQELSLLAELRRAVHAGDLRLHYQPLVDATTGRVQAVEALVRWQHPEHGLLSPAAFVPLAERSTCIVELTDWVLDTALRQLAQWRRTAPHLRVAVNLSARLLADDGLPARIAARLAHHDLPGDALTLEVTESAVATQPETAAALLRQLRAQHVRVAIDDFGAGYTSLSMLAGGSYTEVKVDRSFIQDVTTNPRHAAISRSVVELAHRLDLSVVAEGVEDREVRQTLARWGFDLLQGYLFSRPLPAELVTPLLSGALPLPAGGAATATGEPPPARSWRTTRSSRGCQPPQSPATSRRG